MRPGGSKSKGASFERDVCKALSLWVSGGIREDVFWRSAMSGGRSTVAHAKGKKLSSQAGDLSCIHSVGQPFIESFVAECKFYSNLDYTGLLTGKGKIVAFWEEVNLQANRYGKFPFMVAKQNRLNANVCLSKVGLRLLGLKSHEMLLIAVREDMYLIEFEKFVKVCKPFT